MTDDELQNEQAYQDDAWQALDEMRSESMLLSASAAHVGGNEMAGDLLEAAFASRIKALTPPAGVPLFFGALTRDDGEKQYVGRRHVRDGDKSMLVMDWRAAAAAAYYQASPNDPMSVEVRRRFGHQSGRLTAFEDEPISTSSEDGLSRRALSTLELAEIERPRTGPMRDIVASIQADQDELVRSDLQVSMAVQGGPGTGKTAVGLHRAAFLLYAFANRLKRSGVLFVGPSDIFLDYVSAVLPALGEVDVKQTTFPRLMGTDDTSTTRSQDDVGLLMNDGRMARVLHNILYGGMPEAEDVKLSVSGRIVRFSAQELGACRSLVRARGLDYEPSRKVFTQRLVQMVVDASGKSSADARKSVGAADANLARLWPRVRPATLLTSSFKSPAALAAAADGILDGAEQELLLRRAISSRSSLGWFVLLDELTWLLERGDTYPHVVVDETQDLSPMMLRAVGRRRSVSMTLLGDIAQGTTPWSAESWLEVSHDLGLAELPVQSLVTAFRSTAPIIDLANELLPLISNDVERSVAARTGPPPRLVSCPKKERAATVSAQLTSLLEAPGTLGIIACGAQELAELRHLADERVSVVPVEQCKGLEFDFVIVVEPAAVLRAHDERTGLRNLYVGLTRAVTRLVVAHAEPLPEGLRDAFARQGYVHE